MKRLYAYWLGLREFRLSMTTAYECDTLREWYDKGRDMTHAVTMRRYEDDWT